MKLALNVKQSALYTDLSSRGNSQQYFSQVLGIDYQIPEFQYVDGAISWNFDGDFGYNRAFLLGRTLTTAVQSFLEAMQRESENLQRVARGIAAELSVSPLSNDRIHKLLEKYVGAYERTMPMLFMFWNTEGLLLSQIETSELPMLFPGEEVRRIMGSVLFPPKQNVIALERESLLGLALRAWNSRDVRKAFVESKLDEAATLIETDPEFGHALETHLREFAFTTTAFHLNPPLNKYDVLHRISDLMSADVPEIVAEAAKRREENESAAAQQLAAIAHYHEVYEHLQLARWLLWWKNQRIDMQFSSDFIARPLFVETAKRLGLELAELVFCQFDEIVDGLGGKAIDLTRVKRRQRGYSYTYREGRSVLSEEFENGADVSTLLEVTSDSSLEGEVANPGTAEGPVRIVLGVEDIPRVQKGDILVAPMTRQEMVVALERASAFVTDEGGRLCHAAIVAREMNKPCITGTRIATKILKDGWMVFVDADNGKIEIRTRNRK